MPKHDDLYLRDDLGDDGNFPNNFGGQSPDIISKKAPMNPRQFKKVLVDTWDKRIDDNVAKNKLNYIYTRSKNLGTTDSNGSVDIYWSEGGLLQTLKSWYNKAHLVGSFTIEGSSSAPVPGGKVGVCKNVKMWKPPAEMVETTHYCMIGHLSTAKHPNKIPVNEINTVDKFWGWVRNNPGIAVRNFDFEKIETTNDWVLRLRNMEDERTFIISAELEGLPAGTEGWLHCPDPDHGFLEKFKIEKAAPTTVCVEAKLKGHFEEVLHIRTQLPGGALPGNWKVSLKQIALPMKGDMFIPLDARPLPQLLDYDSLGETCKERLAQKKGLPVGAFTFFSEKDSAGQEAIEPGTASR